MVRILLDKGRVRGWDDPNDPTPYELRLVGDGAEELSAMGWGVETPSHLFTSCLNAGVLWIIDWSAATPGEYACWGRAERDTLCFEALRRDLPVVLCDKENRELARWEVALHPHDLGAIQDAIHAQVAEEGQVLAASFSSRHGTQLRPAPRSHE